MGSYCALLVFCVLGFSIYSNTFSVPFYLEDYARIVDNSDVRLNELTFEGVLRFIDMDRPITMLTFALNYYAGGLELFGYHLVNIAIHILTAFGLFLFLNITLCILDHQYDAKTKRQGRKFIVSGVASLLWFLNPLQTEAVTYIAQRLTGMAAMFYVYSLFFYAKGRVTSGSKRVFYLVSCGVFGILSFESKQNAFALPFFVFLYEIYIFRKGDIGFLRKKGFYIPVLTVVSLFLILLTMFHPGPVNSIFSTYKGMDSLVKERLFTQVRDSFMYASLFLFPLSLRLSIEHDHGISMTFFEHPGTAMGVVVVIIAILFFIVSARKRRYEAIFILWFFLNMVAESSISSFSAMHEHQMYLCSMGLSAISGKWLADLSVNRRWTGVLLVNALFFTFAVNTYARNSVWREPIILWSDAVRKAPSSVDARTGLALSFLSLKKMEEGIAELERAKGINPRDPYVRYSLGVAFYEIKEYDKSTDEFKAVWNMGLDGPVEKPSIDIYIFNMARSFIAHGQVEKGRGLLMDAGKFHPENMKVVELLDKLDKGKLTSEDLRP